LYQPHGSSKFRLYVGLLVNPNVYRKLSKEGEADDDDDGPTDIQTNTKDTSGSVLPARSAYSVELDDHDDDDGPTDIQTNTKDTSGSVLPAHSAYSVELIPSSLYIIRIGRVRTGGDTNIGDGTVRTGGETFHQGNTTRIADDIGGDVNRSNKLG
jgi:hypothetical protein